MAGVVYENDHFRVEVLPGDKVVLLLRSARPFVSAQDADASCIPVLRALDSLDRPTRGLLIDTRRAPLRNDPEYESWFAHHRRAMPLGFRRVAVLVQTETGMLQLRRLRDVDQATIGSFTDMGEALVFLSGLGPVPRPSQTMARVKPPPKE